MFEVYKTTRIIDEDFRIVINRVLLFKGKQTLLLTDNIYDIMNNSGIESYMDIFGKNYWWHFEASEIIMMGGCFNTYAAFVETLDMDSGYPKFNNQIEEIEYLQKLWFNDVYCLTVDVTLPIYKYFIEIVKKGIPIGDIIEYYYFDNNAGDLLCWSVNFISFIYEYTIEFPDDTKMIEMLLSFINSPDSFISKSKKFRFKFNIDFYKQCINNITKEDLKVYRNNVFYYYLDKYRPIELIAVKSFILQLNETCDVDDEEDIIISKSSVKALIKSAGMKAFLNNSH